MNKYELIQQTMNQMKLVIKKFLMAHGGFNNGYMTYVNTTVEYNVFRRVDWSVPSMRKMTMGEYWDLGTELYRELEELINRDMSDVVFRISSSNDSAGCYIINIWAELPKERITLYSVGQYGNLP